MLNKKIIALSLAGIILFGAGGVALKNHGKEIGEGFKEAVSTLPIVDNHKNEGIKKETLTCFDFIDQMLMADGFTYLSGTQWGRGDNNFFIIDIAKKQFIIADAYRTSELPDDWYKTGIDRYAELIYRHDLGEASVEAILRENPNPTMDRDYYTITAAELADPKGVYYELPLWMNRYIEETNKYGCSIAELTENQLLSDYKSKMSKAEVKDVISSFDVKSTDGVIRYFNDVYKIGSIKNDKRYKEINTLKDFEILESADGFEGFYMINILYDNPERFIFERDRSHLYAGILEHFVKDVVYPNTASPDNIDKKMTLGVYFMYVDSPSSLFDYIYSKPDTKSLFYNGNISKDIRYFSMPFDGTVLSANKGMGTPYNIIPTSVGRLYNTLENYIVFINELNPDVQFSDDFLTYYTRPFNMQWQKLMGLESFFDEKYGLINREVKYLH